MPQHLWHECLCVGLLLSLRRLTLAFLPRRPSPQERLRGGPSLGSFPLGALLQEGLRLSLGPCPGPRLIPALLRVDPRRYALRLRLATPMHALPQGITPAVTV